MVDPASVGVLAKIAEAITRLPLWLLVAIALSLSVLLLVPRFHDLVPPAAGTSVLFAALVGWIFVACRATVPAIEVLRARRAASEARVRFVLTPVPSQCFWGKSNQPDGSVATHISFRFMVKNRTDSPLHLMTATLLKPRCSADPPQALVTVQAANGKWDGTAYISGYFIPPRGTLPAKAVFVFLGAPRSKSRVMKATIEITDANANRERVTIRISKYLGDDEAPSRPWWRFGCGA
jgi:hypothetical protein